MDEDISTPPITHLYLLWGHGWLLYFYKFLIKSGHAFS